MITHYALVTGPTMPDVEMIAGGSRQHCVSALARWLVEHPLRDGQIAEVVERVTVGEVIERGNTQTGRSVHDS